MKLAYPMNPEGGLQIDFDAFLTPIPGDDEAGVSLRTDPIYQKIRDARYEDDETLPMGDWERPLIKADWKLVASLCSEALQTRSKDFQLAAWLCEAWIHLHRIDGFAAGTQLMAELADRYWDNAYPKIEDGDTEARIAPLVWINSTLAFAMSLHVPLLLVEGREPPTITLDDWKRLLGPKAGKDKDGLTRELLDKHVTTGGNLAGLIRLAQRLEVAVEAWATFAVLIDDRLGDDSPTLAQVSDVLQQLSRAVTSLIGDHALPEAAPVIEASVEIVADAPAEPPHDAARDSPATAGSPPAAAAPAMVQGAAAGPLSSRIVDRTHAYQLLEAVADYLTKNEPHSPTPYLLKRAALWGKMPLAELMRDIVRQEGDLARYLALLGLE